MQTRKLVLTSLIFGIIVYILVGFGVGIEEFLEALKQVRYEYLVLASLCYALTLLAITFRWELLTKEAKIKVSFWKLYLMTLAGVTFGNLTPSSRMGGEPVRAYFLNKEAECKTKDSFATIVSARIFDAIVFTLISLVIFSYVIISLSLDKLIVSMLFISLVFSVIIIFFIIYISVRPKASQKIFVWLVRKFGRFIKSYKGKEGEVKIKKEVNDYSINMKRFLKNPRLWFYGSTYTLFVWFFDVLRMYLIFIGLGMPVSPQMLIIVLVLSGLVGAIPVIPGGMGVTESTMILIYSSFGIPLVIAGIATLLDRLIYFWLFTFLGLIASYYLGIKKYKE